MFKFLKPYECEFLFTPNFGREQVFSPYINGGRCWFSPLPKLSNGLTYPNPNRRDVLNGLHIKLTFSPNLT